MKTINIISSVSAGVLLDILFINPCKTATFLVTVAASHLTQIKTAVLISMHPDQFIVLNPHHNIVKEINSRY